MDAHTVEFRCRPLGDILQAMDATDGIGVVKLRLVQQTAILDEVVYGKGDFQRNHRTFVRQAHGDDDAAALERRQLPEKVQRVIRRIAVDRVLPEAGDGLWRGPGTCGNDDEVILMDLAALIVPPIPPPMTRIFMKPSF